MLKDLLHSATAAGAEVIATACPLCQANLEVYRAHVNREFGTDFDIPIMYFTQLMGMALGIKNKKLGVGKEIVSTARIVEAVAACRKEAAKAAAE
jgi:heterodisulfide reductase subunit B